MEPTKSRDLVSVSTFRSRADAEKAKGILDEAGIESVIRADPLNWPEREQAGESGYYTARDRAQILVRTDDCDKATEALRTRRQFLLECMRERTVNQCGVFGSILVCALLGMWTYEAGMYAAMFLERSGVLPNNSFALVNRFALVAVFGTWTVIWFGGMVLEAIFGYRIGTRLALLWMANVDRQGVLASQWARWSATTLAVVIVLGCAVGLIAFSEWISFGRIFNPLPTMLWGLERMITSGMQ